MNDQASRLRQLIAERGLRAARAHTVAIASGRGGVGKATLATNLAAALELQGVRVALLDLEGKPQPRAIFDQVGNLTPWQGERLRDGLARIEASAELVLIEAPAGFGAEALRVLAAVPDIVVVTTPDPGAVTDAYALIRLLSERSADAAIRLLVNRARSAQQAQAVAAHMAHAVGRRLASIGFVPEDPVASRAAFVAAHPGSPAARSVREIANRLRRPASGAARSLTDCLMVLAKSGFYHPASAGEPIGT